MAEGATARGLDDVGVAQVVEEAREAQTTAVTRGRCYRTSPETVQVKRAMMAAAARTVLLADHTKFTRDGMYALTSLRDFDLLVVDDGLPDREVRAIRGMGTEVLVVPRAGVN
ncbi:hypothetical protein [Streptomyces sp. NPDC059957]|uniref:hypothetical protein n=1 Tax=Streptomyces sp. NPDC059957 TaxID=3347016 RepID=UPI00365E1161